MILSLNVNGNNDPSISAWWRQWPYQHHHPQHKNSSENNLPSTSAQWWPYQHYQHWVDSDDDPSTPAQWHWTSTVTTPPSPPAPGQWWWWPSTPAWWQWCHQHQHNDDTNDLTSTRITLAQWFRQQQWCWSQHQLDTPYLTVNFLCYLLMLYLAYDIKHMLVYYSNQMYY